MKAHFRQCSGPNAACRKAHLAGRSVHILLGDHPKGHLVLPTYHFTTEVEGRTMLLRAKRRAVMINSIIDLYDARVAQVPYIIPFTWIDPTRRDDGLYESVKAYQASGRPMRVIRGFIRALGFRPAKGEVTRCLIRIKQEKE